MGDSDDGKRPRFFVVAVGRRTPFHRTIAAALADLAGGTDPADASVRELVADGPPPGRQESWPDIYQQALARSRRFLNRALPAAEIRLVCADTLTDAAHKLRRLTAVGHDGDDVMALLLVDAESADVPAAPLEYDGFDKLRAALPDHIRCEFTAYTVFVYDDKPLGPVRLAHPYTRRQLPGRPWVLAADVICSFTDYVQLGYAGPTLRGAVPGAPALLAEELAAFLDERAGSAWGLHYYTGSAVSGLIADLETRSALGGNPVLRGPSEHSLACGALARWQLDEAPFLIVVTSGMIDEFRGTLANLREARARGFIVCAESPRNAWYPMQGTVHGAEDSREVLRARGMEFRYLDDPARLEDHLREAFTAYEADRGPVVLLATPEVLRVAAVPVRTVRSGGETPRDSVPAAGPGPFPADGTTTRPRSRLVIDEDGLAPILDIVNHGPSRLLWQCGRLGAEERDLVHDIAARAGIALADSPGPARSPATGTERSCRSTSAPSACTATRTGSTTSCTTPAGSARATSSVCSSSKAVSRRTRRLSPPGRSTGRCVSSRSPARKSTWRPSPTTGCGATDWSSCARCAGGSTSPSHCGHSGCAPSRRAGTVLPTSSTPCPWCR